jgi:hypothetical protein
MAAQGHLSTGRPAAASSWDSSNEAVINNPEDWNESFWVEFLPGGEFEWHPPRGSEGLSQALSWHYPHIGSIEDRMRAAFRDELARTKGRSCSQSINNMQCLPEVTSGVSAFQPSPPPHVTTPPQRTLRHAKGSISPTISVDVSQGSSTGTNNSPTSSKGSTVTLNMGKKRQGSKSSNTGPRMIPGMNVFNAVDGDDAPPGKRKYTASEREQIRENRGKVCQRHKRSKQKCDPQTCPHNKGRSDSQQQPCSTEQVSTFEQPWTLRQSDQDINSLSQAQLPQMPSHYLSELTLSTHFGGPPQDIRPFSTPPDIDISPTTQPDNVAQPAWAPQPAIGFGQWLPLDSTAYEHRPLPAPPNTDMILHNQIEDSLAQWSSPFLNQGPIPDQPRVYPADSGFRKPSLSSTRMPSLSSSDSLSSPQPSIFTHHPNNSSGGSMSSTDNGPKQRRNTGLSSTTPDLQFSHKPQQEVRPIDLGFPDIDPVSSDHLEAPIVYIPEMERFTSSPNPVDEHPQPPTPSSTYSVRDGCLDPQLLMRKPGGVDFITERQSSLKATLKTANECPRDSKRTSQTEIIRVWRDQSPLAPPSRTTNEAVPSSGEQHAVVLPATTFANTHTNNENHHPDTSTGGNNHPTKAYPRAIKPLLMRNISHSSNTSSSRDSTGVGLGLTLLDSPSYSPYHAFSSHGHNYSSAGNYRAHRASISKAEQILGIDLPSSFGVGMGMGEGDGDDEDLRRNGSNRSVTSNYSFTASSSYALEHRRRRRREAAEGLQYRLSNTSSAYSGGGGGGGVYRSDTQRTFASQHSESLSYDGENSPVALVGGLRRLESLRTRAGACSGSGSSIATARRARAARRKVVEEERDFGEGEDMMERLVGAFGMVSV